VVAPPWHLGAYFYPAKPGLFAPGCSRTVARACQPVQAQAKACGYRKLLMECDSV